MFIVLFEKANCSVVVTTSFSAVYLNSEWSLCVCVTCWCALIVYVSALVSQLKYLYNLNYSIGLQSAWQCLLAFLVNEENLNNVFD